MSFETELSKKINKLKWIMPLCFVFSLLLLVLGITFIMIRGFDGMNREWAFSVGADLFGMAVSATLVFSCVSSSRNSEATGGYTRVFVTLLVINAMAMFLDECCWLVQGVPSFAAFNLVVNVLFYANSAMIVYFFWRYVTDVLDLEGTFMGFLNNVMNIALIPAIIACFVNFFYPLYFSVDFQTGNYVRADGTWILSQVYLAVGVISAILAFIFSKVNVRTKLVAGSFVTIPIINQILTRSSFGISTQYAATLVSIVLIYGILFSDREKILATTGKELALATRIQADMLPNIFPPFPDRNEIDIYASMKPAKEVGGDFYDFFLINDDTLAIVIADVSGKGVPAALFMMVSKILVQNYAMTYSSPKAVLEAVNRQICENNREDMFVTVWLGMLDLKSGVLTAANAGHEYPVMKKKGGQFEYVMDKHGFVIGGMKSLKYSEYQLKMEPGSKLFVYTDGVLEATNKSSELFGKDRLLEALAKAENDNPEEVLKRVREEIDVFVGDAPQFDDITMLCLQYNGKGEQR
ncbi:MAG: PP2C family protein-serine/threonine phosphatase [Clostridia bacterium]|nr:PP2C family protein-serine/threonine phosphatase [Clostridia bacterium]